MTSISFCQIAVRKRIQGTGTYGGDAVIYTPAPLLEKTLGKHWQMVGKAHRGRRVGEDG